jgi:hypothetical protein
MIRIPAWYKRVVHVGPSDRGELFEGAQSGAGTLMRMIARNINGRDDDDSKLLLAKGILNINVLYSALKPSMGLYPVTASSDQSPKSVIWCFSAHRIVDITSDGAD